FMTVRASTAKNHREATLPLHPDLAAELRLIHPGELLQHQRVFRRLPEMETYKADLHRAEVAYVDRAGRRADFHALRKTFCTNLHRGGVPPRVAMAWMRHSDMKLTMRTYTDETALPLR